MKLVVNFISSLRPSWAVAVIVKTLYNHKYRHCKATASNYIARHLNFMLYITQGRGSVWNPSVHHTKFNYSPTRFYNWTWMKNIRVFIHNRFEQNSHEIFPSTYYIWMYHWRTQRGSFGSHPHFWALIKTFGIYCSLKYVLNAVSKPNTQKFPRRLQTQRNCAVGFAPEKHTAHDAKYGWL